MLDGPASLFLGPDFALRDRSEGGHGSDEFAHTPPSPQILIVKEDDNEIGIEKDVGGLFRKDGPRRNVLFVEKGQNVSVLKCPAQRSCIFKTAAGN
jgi:hypothetical protein